MLLNLTPLFSTTCFHLPFILPNHSLKVHAFLQRSAAPDPSTTPKGKHCAVDYPHVKHYRDADSFFGDKEIDLVIVCSHGDTHADFAERAMKSGKHGMFPYSTDETSRFLRVAV